ncbi:hypothetical protein [Nitratiruptor sp. YY09-18]|uniref:hypothetical protein n=1 Tax=Nitratiruptor sp. YY09-18 TaxID=2724901 RepID=UPI0019155776|nr:hypothetical protein [Nitratiruptor sp. YY09-18]BCD67325.1 hypothetical protein NitYY0918_C0204 [Nitratiruptor sp. YY09-18]
MKNLLTSLIFFAASFSTALANDSTKLNLHNGTLRGVVGNSAVFIYKGKKFDMIANVDDDKIKLKKIENILKKSICSNKKLRSIVIDQGIGVLYIYEGSSKNNQATAIYIDSCK